MLKFTLPILFLKATQKKQVWIEGYTRHDGVFVPGHHTMVHFSDDHSHENVVAGKGTYSQQNSHKVISKQSHFSGLPTVDQQAYHIMEHATAQQDKETANSNVSKYQKSVLAGKKPSDILVEALLSASQSKREAVFNKLQAAGESFVDESATAISNYLDKTGKTFKDFQKQDDGPSAVKEQAIQSASENVTEQNASAKELNLPDDNASSQIETAINTDQQDDSIDHATHLSDIAALPKANYKKQAHDKLSKDPEWSNWSDKEKHDKVLALYKELQSTASAKSNVNTLKKKLKEGKSPSKTEINSFLAQPKEKQLADLEGLKVAGVSEDAISGLMKDALKQPEPVKAVEPEAKPAPKILFTKPAAKVDLKSKQDLINPVAVKFNGKYWPVPNGVASAVSQSNWGVLSADGKKALGAGGAPSVWGTKSVASEMVNASQGMVDSGNYHWVDVYDSHEEALAAKNKSLSIDSSNPEQSTNDLDIKTFTHSSKGHVVHAVQLPSKKIPDEEYKQVAAIAKQHKGFYSSFKKDGAIPGFHFKNNEAAQAFIEEAGSIISGNAQPSSIESKKADQAQEKQGTVAPKVASITEKPSNKDQAPVGTNVVLGGIGYEKVDDAWKDLDDGTLKGGSFNIPAALEILAGKKPNQVWLDTKSDSHKLTVAEMVLDQGSPNLTPGKVLSIIFPADAEDGPKEGDIKTISGVQYVLQNGRWHKVGDDEKSMGSGKTGLDAIEIPNYTAIDSHKNTKYYADASQKLLDAVKADGMAGFTKCITTHKTGYFAGTYSTKHSVLGLKVKHLSNNSAFPRMKAFYDFIEQVKAELEANSGKKTKSKSKTASANKEGAKHSEPKILFTQSVAPAKSVKMDNGLSATVMDNWKQVGAQAGSNEGGKYIDNSGKEWYCKFPADEDVAKNEVLASKFYHMLGVKVPHLKFVQKDGKLGIASAFEDGLKVGSASELAVSEGVHDAFVFDAWLANWDVVGMSNDNLMLDKDGKAVHVDVGGSLLYRAQGDKKGDQFGNDVNELETFLDDSKNPKSASVFSGVSKEALRNGANKLALMHPSQIKKLCNIIGPGSREEQGDLAKKLIARREYILKKLGVKDPWDEVAPDITKLRVEQNDLPKKVDFENFNNTGKGLSASAFFNKQNSRDSSDLFKFASKGNLKALLRYKYKAVDKETGTLVGENSIGEHPSKHIKDQWANSCDVLTAIAHPTIKGLDLPNLGGSSVEEVSDSAGYFKPGENINTISKEKVLGFWMKLGNVGAESMEDLKPKKTFFFDKAMIDSGNKWYKGISEATKAIINAIQDSGQNNRFWNKGDKTISVSSHGHSYSGGAQSLANQCYQDAAEHEEGSTVGRWMNMPQGMMDSLLNEGPGLVFQNADSMCCSVHEHWGNSATFGSGAFLNIRYASGAKALDSFGDGRFSGEKEVTTLMGARFVVLDVKKGNSSSSNGITMELLMLPPHEGYIAELDNMAALGKSMVILFISKINKGVK